MAGETDNQQNLKKGEGEGPSKITLQRKKTEVLEVRRASGGKGTVSIVHKRRHVYVKHEAGVTAEVTEETVSNPVAESITETVAPPVSPVMTEAEPEAVTPVSEETPVLTSAPVMAPSTAPRNAFDTNPALSKKEGWGGVKKSHGGESRHLIEEAEKKRGRPHHRSKGRVSDTEWDKVSLVQSLAVVADQLETVEETPLNGDVAILDTKPKVVRVTAAAIKPPKRDLKKVIAEIKKKHNFEKPAHAVARVVTLSSDLTVSQLAQKLSVKSTEVLKVLMKLGVVATLNQTLDLATATIVVEEMGHRVNLNEAAVLEPTITEETNTGVSVPRAAVVTIMGHVDHGKTTLLDYIRRTKIAAQEAGGITQHIGAYSVATSRGLITFLDTPGHAAFTAMRARGAQCTDLVVLVVAADDGVMPQTIEAIQHAKAAGVPLVVAVNKIDKQSIDLERIQHELSQQGVIPEAWGGDVMMIPVSAKEGTGVEALLEAIALQAELLELKAQATGSASGVVLEARLDKGKGPVLALLVQQGTLKSGDMVLAGQEYGRVRAMINEKGQVVTSVGPSMPIEVLGLSGAPRAGEHFRVVADERQAREIALFRQNKKREEWSSQQQTAKLEGFFERLQQGHKVLKLVLKADVQGSAEALVAALEALSTDQVRVSIMATGVGGINESDVTLAIASGAVLIGFNVRADAAAKRLITQAALDVYYSGVIYEVVDTVKRAMSGLLGPEYKEQILGLAEVRSVFRSAKWGAVAGCMVIEGNIKRGYPIRVLRDNRVIYQGELESLRRFKDDVSDVRHGMECGIGVKEYNDIREGDQIEVYETVKVNKNL